MNFTVFSDLHLNKFPYANITKTGENELLMSGLNIIDQVYNYSVEHGIKYIFFLGDLFHIRSKIDSEIYSSLTFEKLCQYFGEETSPNLILVPGNHDQISKSGRHLLLPFSKIRNVTVINDFYKQGNMIICPHQYKNENLYTFLKANSDKNSFVFMHQLLMNSPAMSGAIFRKNEAVDVSQFSYKYIFSGHNHRPFKNKDLNVYNVGSPMHYDFGDAECQDRFFIHYSEGVVKWVNTTFPRFALHGSTSAPKASYIRKKSKKIEQLSNRIEIDFNDDVGNIMKVYLDSIETSLNKVQLLKEGHKLLSKETSNVLQADN